MKNLILLLTPVFFVFQAFSFETEKYEKADVDYHHSKNPVVFQVDVDRICPEGDPPDFFGTNCETVKTAIKDAAAEWTGVTGSDFAFKIEFSDDDNFSGQVPLVDAFDGVNVIEHTNADINPHSPSFSVVTITSNDEGEILDVDIKIQIKEIKDKPLFSSSDAKKKRAYDWVLLHSLGRALGLASRTGTGDSEIVSGSIMDARDGTASYTAATGDLLKTDDKKGIENLYKRNATTTTSAIDFGDDENIKMTGGLGNNKSYKIFKFEVPAYIKDRYLLFKGAASNFFTSVKLELPSGYDVPYGEGDTIGNSSLGNKDARFGFMRYAHPGNYRLIFEKPETPDRVTDVWVLVDLSEEVKSLSDGSYVEENSVFQQVIMAGENIKGAADVIPAPPVRNKSLAAGEIHHYLFRVLTEGTLTVSSTGLSDMIGDLCEYSNDGGSGSICSYQDDISGTDRNFRFNKELEAGEYILSVRQYEYGSATYGLTYSFTP